MEDKGKKLAAAAVACAVAIGGAAMPASAMAAEKCYGVVKAGSNDCGNANHACAGQSSMDADPNEWVYLPDGTCEKLVGGSKEPSA